MPKFSSRRRHNIRRRKAFRSTRRLRRRHSKFAISSYKRLPLVYPNINIVRLRYVRTIAMNPAVNTPATYTILCNGLFDPEAGEGTGLGHQPLGYEQMLLQYTYATVLQSRCKILNQQNSTTSVAVPSYIAVRWSKQRFTSTTFVTSEGTMMDYWNEAYPGKRMQFGLAGNQQVYGGKEGSPYCHYNAMKVWGNKRALLAATTNHANQLNANPNAAVWSYFNIVAMAPDAVVDPSQVLVTAQVDYIVAFHGKKVLPQSLF